MCSGTGQDSPRSQTLHLNLWSCLLPSIIVCNYDIASICWQTGLKRSLTGEESRPDTGEGGSLPRWWRCLVVTIDCFFDHRSDGSFYSREDDFDQKPPGSSLLLICVISTWTIWEISQNFDEIEFNRIFDITSSAGHSTLAMSTVCKPLKF